jgi:hypothetical protein
MREIGICYASRQEKSRQNVAVSFAAMIAAFANEKGGASNARLATSGFN